MNAINTNIRMKSKTPVSKSSLGLLGPGNPILLESDIKLVPSARLLLVVVMSLFLVYISVIEVVEYIVDVQLCSFNQIH